MGTALLCKLYAPLALRLPPDQGNRLLRGVAGETDDGEE
jgi:hypothetical protein